jgi:hypothetical protein
MIVGGHLHIPDAGGTPFSPPPPKHFPSPAGRCALALQGLAAVQAAGSREQQQLLTDAANYLQVCAARGRRAAGCWCSGNGMWRSTDRGVQRHATVSDQWLAVPWGALLWAGTGSGVNLALSA